MELIDAGLWNRTMRVHVQRLDGNATEMYVYSQQHIDVRKLGTLEWNSIKPSIVVTTPKGERVEFQKHHPVTNIIRVFNDREEWKKRLLKYEQEWVWIVDARLADCEEPDNIELQEQLTTTCGGGGYINAWNGSPCVVIDLLELGAVPSAGELIDAIYNDYNDIIRVLLANETLKLTSRGARDVLLAAVEQDNITAVELLLAQLEYDTDVIRQVEEIAKRVKKWDSVRLLRNARTPTVPGLGK